MNEENEKRVKESIDRLEATTQPPVVGTSGTPTHPTTIRRADGLDVAEGRRLLAAMTEGPWEVLPDFDNGRCEVYIPNGTMTTETVLSFSDWLDCEECGRPSLPDLEGIAWMRNNLPALLDAAEDVWELRAQVAETGTLYRALRAEHAALKERIGALADNVAMQVRHGHAVSAEPFADDLRALSSDGTAVRADDRAGEGS